MPEEREVPEERLDKVLDMEARLGDDPELAGTTGVVCGEMREVPEE